MAYQVDVNSAHCEWVLCRDGRTYWLEERDHEAYPTIPATSNVIAGFNSESDARAELAATLILQAIDGLDCSDEEAADLLEIWNVEGFGGREERVTNERGAEELVAEMLDWARSERFAAEVR